MRKKKLKKHNFKSLLFSIYDDIKIHIHKFFVKNIILCKKKKKIFFCCR